MAGAASGEQYARSGEQVYVLHTLEIGRWLHLTPAVGLDTRASRSGDNTRTRRNSCGRRADNHLTTCCVRPREETRGVLAAWHPRGEPTVKVG